MRTLVQRELNAALGDWDLLLSPAAPTTAYRIGEARPTCSMSKLHPESGSECMACRTSQQCCCIMPCLQVCKCHTMTMSPMPSANYACCVCQVCDDPLEMYQGDLMTVNLNLAGARPSGSHSLFWHIGLPCMTATLELLADLVFLMLFGHQS